MVRHFIPSCRLFPPPLFFSLLFFPFLPPSISLSFSLSPYQQVCLHLSAHPPAFLAPVLVHASPLRHDALGIVLYFMSAPFGLFSYSAPARRLLPAEQLEDLAILEVSLVGTSI